MIVSGFVRDAHSVSLERLRRYHDEGILGRVYLLVEHNEPAIVSGNKALYPTWDSVLPGHVYAWLWGTEDADADAARVNGLRNEISARRWLLNEENPTKGKDRTVLYEACFGDPTVISPNGYPHLTPYDYRHMSHYGFRVEWQGYSGAEQNDKLPSDIVREAFTCTKLIARDTGAPSAWWYRVYFDNLATFNRRWAWAQVESFTRADPPRGWIKFREGRNLWWIEARETAWGYELNNRNVLNGKTHKRVGTVFGVARYPSIGYSLSVERAQTPTEIADLARGGRVPGAAIRETTLWTFDNATDEHVRALAALV